ncbi:MAG: hypothetical protein IPH35_24025 [Rhodoferax sp.]|nr:hypothetical protein [Rhodoferax sp.]
MTQSTTHHVTAAEAVMLEIIWPRTNCVSPGLRGHHEKCHRCALALERSRQVPVVSDHEPQARPQWEGIEHAKSYHLDQATGEFQFKLSYVELYLETGLTHSEGRTSLRKLIELGLVKAVPGNAKPAIYALQLQTMTDMLVSHSKSNLHRQTPSIADLKDDRVFNLSMKRPTPPRKPKTEPTPRKAASVSAA